LVVLPLIVVGDPLFECYLNEQNEVVLEKAGHLQLYWKNTGVDALGYDAIIDVVTADHLATYVARVSEACMVLVRDQAEMIQLALVHANRREDVKAVATSTRSPTP
jgi:hypothetical protein